MSAYLVTIWQSKKLSELILASTLIFQIYFCSLQPYEVHIFVTEQKLFQLKCAVPETGLYIYILASRSSVDCIFMWLYYDLPLKKTAIGQLWENNISANKYLCVDVMIAKHCLVYHYDCYTYRIRLYVLVQGGEEIFTNIWIC